MTTIKFFIPLTLLIILSCQGQESEQEEATEAIVIEAIADSLKDKLEQEWIDSTLIPVVETHQFGDLTMTITPNESSDCIQGGTLDQELEGEVYDAEGWVERRGDSLILQPIHGENVVLVTDEKYNDYYENSGYSYNYQGELEELEYWVIWALGFETYHTILINKSSGSQTRTVGKPIVSPSGDFIITGNADMEMDHTENCMYLYEVDNNELELKGKAVFSGESIWAPYEIAWIDNQTLTIKQGRFDESDYSIKYNCAEVRIEK